MNDQYLLGQTKTTREQQYIVQIQNENAQLRKMLENFMEKYTQLKTKTIELEKNNSQSDNFTYKTQFYTNKKDSFESQNYQSKQYLPNRNPLTKYVKSELLDNLLQVPQQQQRGSEYYRQRYSEQIEKNKQLLEELTQKKYEMEELRNYIYQLQNRIKILEQTEQKKQQIPKTNKPQFDNFLNKIGFELKENGLLKYNQLYVKQFLSNYMIKIKSTVEICNKLTGEFCYHKTLFDSQIATQNEIQLLYSCQNHLKQTNQLICYYQKKIKEYYDSKKLTQLKQPSRSKNVVQILQQKVLIPQLNEQNKELKFIIKTIENENMMLKKYYETKQQQISCENQIIQSINELIGKSKYNQNLIKHQINEFDTLFDRRNSRRPKKYIK